MLFQETQQHKPGIFKFITAGGQRHNPVSRGPVTADHLCYFVNGMLSMPGGVGGLFTYGELNAIEPLSEERFEAAGGAYLKISIGKGNLTMEELVSMIRRYSKFFN